MSRHNKKKFASWNKRPEPATATGPRTPEGKAVSSRNAVLHGLSGAHIILPHEDAAAFDQLCSEADTHYRPQDIEERFLVREIAESQWLLARARRLQAALFRLICLGDTATPSTPDERIAAYILGKSGDASAKLERYAAAASRSFYKAIERLETIRAEQTPFPDLASFVAAQPLPGAAHQFVLQNTALTAPEHIPALQNPRPGGAGCQPAADC